LTKKELKVGKTKYVHIEVSCPVCKGDGYLSGSFEKECKRCGGEGVIEALRKESDEPRA